MKAGVIVRFFVGDVDSSLLMDSWNDSIKSFPDIDDIAFIKDEFIIRYGTFAGVSRSILEHIIAEKNILIQDDDLVKFLWHSVKFVYDPANADTRRAAIPVMDKALPNIYPTFFFLLLLAGIPQAITLYEHNKWPINILKDTLKDFGVWLEHSEKEFGIIGLNHHNFCWITGLLDGKTIRLGRLQFQKLDFTKDIRVFRHKNSGEVKILCGDGVRYNSQGLIDGVGGVWDESGHWNSSFQQVADKVTGNPISEAGFAENSIVELRLDEWKDVLHKGDKTINVHIPAGAPLDPDACRESFELAKAFFRKHFPDYKFKAIVCFSWFLDNQFEEIVGEDANIVKFQHLGRIYPIAGESAAVNRIFGHKADKYGINSVPHKTSMQRAVAKFVNNGGVLHNSGMVLL